MSASALPLSTVLAAAGCSDVACVTGVKRGRARRTAPESAHPGSSPCITALSPAHERVHPSASVQSPARSIRSLDAGRVGQAQGCVLTAVAAALHPSSVQPHAVESDASGARGGVPLLLGREKQIQSIVSFVQAKVEARTGGSMYVSGSPGVGKTAAVSIALEQVQRWAAAAGGALPRVHFFNGHTLCDTVGDKRELFRSVVAQIVAAEASHDARASASKRARMADGSAACTGHESDDSAESLDDEFARRLTQAAAVPAAAVDTVAATGRKKAAAQASARGGARIGGAAGGKVPLSKAATQAAEEAALSRTAFATAQSATLTVPSVLLSSVARAAARGLAASAAAAAAATTAPAVPAATGKSKARATAAIPAGARAGSSKSVRIVVVDELDALVLGAPGASDANEASSRAGALHPGVQALLQLLSWPHDASAAAQAAMLGLGGGSTRRLAPSVTIVIGIANAVDMTQRFLPQLQSRGVTPQPLVFTPYSATQLARIAQQRVTSAVQSWMAAASAAHPAWAAALGGHTAEEAHVVDPRAVELLSKRVANASGDVRKVLDLLESTLSASLVNSCAKPAPLQQALHVATAAASPSTSRTPSACLAAVSPALSLGSTLAATSPVVDASFITLGDDMSCAAASPSKHSSVSPLSVLIRSPSRAASPNTAGAGQHDTPHMCACCQLALPWLQPSAAAAAAAAGKWAVSLADAARHASAVFNSKHLATLRALPPHAQLLVCAARALAEREAKRAAIAADAAANRHSFVAPSEASDAPGTDARAAAGAGRRGRSARTAAAAAAADAAVEVPSAVTPVSLLALQEALAAFCARVGMSAPSKMDFGDWMDRLLSDGIFALHTGGANSASGGSASSATGGKASTSDATKGRRRTPGANVALAAAWVTTYIRVNVVISELDAALSTTPFYATIAADVHAGRI